MVSTQVVSQSVSWSPARRHPPSHPSTHGGGNADCVTHEITEFRHFEPTKDRNYSVVTTDSVKAQRKGYQPETSDSHPAAPQVGNNDASPCHPIHLPDELNGIIEGKMMQDLRRDHEVKCVRRKRQRQGIARHSRHWELSRRPHQLYSAVEAEHIERHLVACGKRAEAIGDVTSACANVQECCRASGFAQRGLQLRLHGINTAEEPVG